MAIIQKRADELKPGDVLTGDLKAVVISSLSNGYIWHGAPNGYGTVDISTLSPAHADLFEVEARDLTPAQQHAEELHKYAEMFFRQYCNGERADAGDDGKLAYLLDAIAPPAPPTLEEALEALRQVVAVRQTMGDHEASEERAKDLLDRARRAGVMP
jgi:hypothetical protein